MPPTQDERFTGAMPPEMFLQRFMACEHVSSAPLADFSGMQSTHTVGDMCKYLTRTVKRLKLCPGMRVFTAKTTRRKGIQGIPDALSQSHLTTGGLRGEEGLQEWAPCPAVAVRVQPKARRNVTRKEDIIEYYDFATALLDVEITNRPEADPFVDPSDSASSCSTSVKSNEESHSSRSCYTPAATFIDETSPSEPCPAPARQHTCEAPAHHAKSPTPTSKSSYYDPFESSSPEGTVFRAGLSAHVQAQFTRQHRCFILQLVIIHRWARFLRWDRSGAVVTERFDYVSHPELLAEFFYRFAHMSDEERGFDPTVKVADRRETGLFKQAVQEFMKDMDAKTKDGRPVRRLPNAELSLDDTGTYPAWTVQVVNETTSQSTRLVINRPFAGEPCLFGRATRAYIAYDLQEHRLVFLKDAWRISSSQLRAEFKIYKELHAHAIPHVPEVWYGGDVLALDGTRQKTLTQALAVEEEPWRIVDGSSPKHIHHRIVQDIAYPLESALSEREFLQAMCDAVTAVEQAYDLAGLLHRDLSYRNAMITPGGRGVLNDWDHAGKKGSTTRRVGTWQFMSIPLLENPKKVHDIVDDLQSIFWVLIYGALKHFTLPDQSLPMEVFSHQTIDRKGRRFGGRWKLSSIALGSFRNLDYSSAALKNLVSKSDLVWRDYHAGINGARQFASDEKLHAEIMEGMESAKKPSFWVEAFATALSELDAEHELQRAEGRAHQSIGADSEGGKQGSHPGSEAIGLSITPTLLHNGGRETANKRKTPAVIDTAPLGRPKRFKQD